jgi:hypothetical protein
LKTGKVEPKYLALLLSKVDLAQPFSKVVFAPLLSKVDLAQPFSKVVWLHLS